MRIKNKFNHTEDKENDLLELSRTSSDLYFTIKVVPWKDIESFSNKLYFN